jgi:uncharacterized protein YjiS (DUF1127 family)
MNIKQKLANYRRYRQVVRELNALDSRDLADLGITRGDIHAVALGKPF